MKYYAYVPDSDVYNGVSCQPNSLAGDLFYDDTARLQSWTPIEMAGFKDNPGRDGDFPSIAAYCSLPLVSERAWLAIEPMIGKSCEALPVNYFNHGPHFILHHRKAIDALDLERAEVLWRPTGDSIAKVRRFAFKSNVLMNEHLFRLPVKRGGGLYFDETFRRTIEENRLEGLSFRELPMVGLS